MIRPPALRIGDLVGVVAPASPTASFVPRRLTRGVAELERRGFRVRLGEHVAAPATNEQKLADLHAMFADDEVRAVVTTIGGSDSHQLLPDLDFDLIGANPKPFVGYSDVTALHAGIWSRTRLAVAQGPAVLVQWGEFGGIDEYSWSSWERTLMRAEPAGELPVSPEWWHERLRWDEEDDRLQERLPNKGPRAVREGAGEGPLVAANLCTLLLLAGTPWWPPLDGALLVLEAAEEEQVWWIERSLHQLRQVGVLARAAGLAFGRLHPVSETTEEELDECLLAATAGLSLPVAAGLDFGHTQPLATLPWGVGARLEGATLTLLEAAVA